MEERVIKARTINNRVEALRVVFSFSPQPSFSIFSLLDVESFRWKRQLKDNVIYFPLTQQTRKGISRRKVGQTCLRKGLLSSRFNILLLDKLARKNEGSSEASKYYAREEVKCQKAVVLQHICNHIGRYSTAKASKSPCKQPSHFNEKKRED